METALRELGRREQGGGGITPTPPGFEVIDRVQNPVDKAELLLLMFLIYRSGPLAASMAVLAGAPMKSAYAIHDFMIMAWRWTQSKYVLNGILAGLHSPKSQKSSTLTFLIKPTGSPTPSWPENPLTCKLGKLGRANAAHHYLAASLVGKTCHV